MPMEIDRVQLAVADRPTTARAWSDLLGAEADGEDRVAALGAVRTTLRLGRGCIELLAADGSGRVADALARRRGPHLFAAGVSVPDPAVLAVRLGEQPVAFAEQDGQLFLAGDAFGVKGFDLVISAFAERPMAGLVDYLYEATLLTADVEAATAGVSRAIGIDRMHEVAITSDTFGYDGVLTLFKPDVLHRFEIIATTRADTTMARQFGKVGQALYMAFGESARIGEIERRAVAAGVGLTVDRPEGRSADLPPDQLWLHPSALGGMMLGISRPTQAWHWSGQPQRVIAID